MIHKVTQDALGGQPDVGITGQINCLSASRLVSQPLSSAPDFQQMEAILREMSDSMGLRWHQRPVVEKTMAAGCECFG